MANESFNYEEIDARAGGLMWIYQDFLFNPFNEFWMLKIAFRKNL